MTAEELEALAVVQTEVRIGFNRLSARALTWEPAPCPDWWRPACRRR